MFNFNRIFSQMATSIIVFSLAWVLISKYTHNDRAVFIQKTYSIREGMSVNEVQAVMKGYFVNPTSNSMPTTNPMFTGHLSYRWNTTDAAYDADVASFDFKDGMVTKAEFLPD